jgi:hypothetical protein
VRSIEQIVKDTNKQIELAQKKEGSFETSLCAILAILNMTCLDICERLDAINGQLMELNRKK